MGRDANVLFGLSQFGNRTLRLNKMADNGNFEVETEKDEQGGRKVTHCFSETWGDSDVILVVEDEKFHVHRVILSLNSPVFKAMFKSQFKEATASEVPLPGKKAVGMLDFLKKIYGFQYIKEHVEITMANVEDLLQLSDEYQVVEHFFNPCVKFLENQPKTKENVMKILALAELYDLEKVRWGCNDLLKDMRLETLSETVNFQDLEREKLQHFLTQRIEWLETILKEVYSQFTGLLIYCFRLWFRLGEGTKLCPLHFTYGKPCWQSGVFGNHLKECKKCKGMLKLLVDDFNRGFDVCTDIISRPVYVSHHYLDINLPDIIENLSKCKKH